MRRLLPGAAAVALLAGWAPAQDAPAVVTALTLFAGTERGPWLSRNWGGDWEPIERESADGDDPAKLGATRVIRPIGPLVYLGGQGGVYVSEDFGIKWQRLDLEASATAVLPSRYPQADLTLFVATDQGLLRSADFGRSFAHTALWGTRVHRIEWPGPALIAATDRGVMVSNDAGASFEGPGSGFPSGPARAVALSSFYAIDPVLFAGVGSSGVVHSADGGRTWDAAGLDGREVTDLIWLGPFLYAVANDGVYRSQDLGQEWVPLTRGLGEARPRRILFPLAPDAGVEAFLATDRGVYHTADGGESWTPSGLEGQDVSCLATFPPPSSVGKKKR